MRWRLALTCVFVLVLAAPAGAYLHTRVVYVPAAGGTARTLLTLPGRFASFDDVEWTADGRAVTGLQDGYTVRRLGLDGRNSRVAHLGGLESAVGAGRVATQLLHGRVTVRGAFRRRICRHVYGRFFEAMEFSRDGSRLAVLVKDRPHQRHLIVLDSASGRVLVRTPLNGIRFLEDDPFDATGAHVLVMGGQVHALDVAAGRLRRVDAGRLEYAVYAPAAPAVAGFGFYSDGAAFGPPFTHSGHTPGHRQVSAVAWDPGGTSVLVGFAGRLDRISAPGRPAQQTRLADVGKGYITSIAPSPDGTGIVAVVTEDPEP